MLSAPFRKAVKFDHMLYVTNEKILLGCVILQASKDALCYVDRIPSS